MATHTHIGYGIVLAAALALLLAAHAAAQEAPSWQAPIVTHEVDGEIHVEVMDNGVAAVHGEYKMSTSAYKLFREMYNPLSTSVRRFNWGSTPSHLVDVRVEADDANNRVTISYRQYSAAVYIGNNKWKLQLTGPGDDVEVKLLSSQGNKLVLMAVYTLTRDFKYTETLHLTLPSKAKNIEYSPEEKTVYYTLPLPGENSGGELKAVGVGLTVAGIALALVASKQARRRGVTGEYLPPPPIP